MFRANGILKLAGLMCALLLVVFLAFQLLDDSTNFKLGNMFIKSLPESLASVKPIKNKCGIAKPCPQGHFAFKLTSGAASVVGPRMCMEDNLIMSSVKNNVGRGINIALLDGRTGAVKKTSSYDMWGGDVAPLIAYLKEIEEGTIVMMASFDDPATKLNDEARKLIAELGSTAINNLGFRDNWIFVGGKGIKTKSPFEQYIKNSVESNKFDGWPDVLEMDGCIPQRHE